MIYLISYDLVGEEKDYPNLHKKLNELGASKVLESQRVVESEMTVRQLAKSLLEFLDEDDKLLVNSIDIANAVTHKTINPIGGVSEITASEAVKLLRRLNGINS